jgi:osmotically-inducible protein OsmY
MKKRSGIFLLAAGLVTTIAVGACSKLPEPAASTPSSSTAAGNVADIDVTHHVTIGLSQNESLKGLPITVETLKGDVRLAGVVDSQAQVDAAIKIARASEGVHSIHNELSVKK